MTEASELPRNMEDQQNLEETRKYVEKNIIPLIEGSECVDGRNEPKGRPARAGAHLGYVMILMALSKELNLDYTSKKAFDSVYNFVTKDGSFFEMHSDTHADPEEESHAEEHHGPIIGCGHAAKPTNPELSDAYGLIPEEQKEMIEYSRERVKNGDKIKFEVLKGEHKEKGVLVVMSKDKTVKHFEGEDMYFVYDKLKDDEFIENFVKELNDPRITLEKFKETSDKQTDATLHNLAAGKPIYSVEIVDSQSKVDLVGKVA